MLAIAFIPESAEFTKASKEYDNIWLEQGADIILAIENATGLDFKETATNATVFEGISQSHPLKLRASYDADTKKASLIHELLHRISSDYMLKLPVATDDLSLGLHKQIDLVLYDIWCTLYGKQFADQQVKIESQRSKLYEEAWGWALQFSAQELSKMFSELLPGEHIAMLNLNV